MTRKTLLEICLHQFLSVEERDECFEEAYKRVDEHVNDGNAGDKRATLTNGVPDTMDARTQEKRLEHAYMSTLGEKIGSKLTKSRWSKETGQYKGNKNPDLSVIFNGKRLQCEVQTTGHKPYFLYRPQRLKRYWDTLFIYMFNLPKGPICKIGHIFYRDIPKVIEGNPEVKIETARGGPAYRVPYDCLSGDFSKFGE